ncbi:hypothetical protein B0H34DRAFT_718701 [Crassisporium funariophilum]|nr:hypothetical protein B0H34DRAFT_718701 [Crassisporium funariophilum]
MNAQAVGPSYLFDIVINSLEWSTSEIPTCLRTTSHLHLHEMRFIILLALTALYGKSSSDST